MINESFYSAVAITCLRFYSPTILKHQIQSLKKVSGLLNTNIIIYCIISIIIYFDYRTFLSLFMWVSTSLSHLISLISLSLFLSFTSSLLSLSLSLSVHISIWYVSTTVFLNCYLYWSRGRVGDKVDSWTEHIRRRTY